MANWDEFYDTLGRVANKAARKTEALADSASKYVKLKSIDSKLNSKYEVLGRLTYKQLKGGSSETEKISCVIEEIDSLRERRQALRTEIENDKKAREEEKLANIAEDKTEE